MPDSKHENYEILNLIGYGLSKFNTEFINGFGFKAKTDFYRYIVKLGVVETESVVKNRQDLFDNFFDNGRKGWWQKGNAYIHRKHLIDSLYGDYDAENYVENVKLYLKYNFKISELKTTEITPIIKSKFKKLQETGRQAELFFKENYQQIEIFENGILEDARLLGDGYDFQIKLPTKNFLVDIKGVRESSGAFRMTDREFRCAREYKNDYGLIVVSNLENIPKMTTIFNPIQKISLRKIVRRDVQISFHSKSMTW